DRQLRASENRGKPPVAATPKPAEFRDRAVVRAREAGGPYNPPANRQETRPRDNGRPLNGGDGDRNNNRGNAVHPEDLPPFDRPAPSNSGDARRDNKHQQQQEKLNTKQDRERQKLQQKQEQEHQKIARQDADEPRKQQVEQRHQQQTQRLEQNQEQQRQR